MTRQERERDGGERGERVRRERGRGRERERVVGKSTLHRRAMLIGRPPSARSRRPSCQHNDSFAENTICRKRKRRRSYILRGHPLRKSTICLDFFDPLPPCSHLELIHLYYVHYSMSNSLPPLMRTYYLDAPLAAIREFFRRVGIVVASGNLRFIVIGPSCLATGGGVRTASNFMCGGRSLSGRTN